MDAFLDRMHFVSLFYDENWAIPLRFSAQQCAKENCWVQAEKYWVTRSQPTTIMRQESQIGTELSYLTIPWLLCACPPIV